MFQKLRPIGSLSWLAVLGLCLVSIAGAANPAPAADFVFRNGSIYTLDAASSVASALAVKGGYVSSIGQNHADIEALIGADTKVIDLQGRMLMPGLIDSHMHVLTGGLGLLHCDMNYQPVDIGQPLAHIQGCIDSDGENADDDWVEVVNLDYPSLVTKSGQAGRQVAKNLPASCKMPQHASWSRSPADRSSEAGGLPGRSPLVAPGRHHHFPESIGGPGSFRVVQPASGEWRADRPRLLRLHHRAPRVAARGKRIRRQHRGGDQVDARQGDDGPEADAEVAGRQGVSGRGHHVPAQDGGRGDAYWNPLNASDPESGEWALDPSTLNAPYWSQDILSATLEGLFLAGTDAQLHVDCDLTVRYGLDAAQAFLEKHLEKHPDRKGDSRLGLAHEELSHQDDWARFDELGVDPIMSFQWAQLSSFYIPSTFATLGDYRRGNLQAHRRIEEAGRPTVYGSDWLAMVGGQVVFATEDARAAFGVAPTFTNGPDQSGGMIRQLDSRAIGGFDRRGLSKEGVAAVSRLRRRGRCSHKHRG
ncbi:amidohydrolase family-domain-containing protein [Apiospora saccharicola]|uniref:Amidohydrolase family-domain-containing protein n=1 Tax=Apiospora saccharicola TaxID=335842 RepID=A0ABR1VBR6_9PEZI